MEKMILKVDGMSCSHCVSAVTKAVVSLDGVLEVDVKLETKTVTVEYDSGRVGFENIKEAIEDEGYDVK
ncbi:MAG: copper chaperone CopZ [Peptostreptococcaceae bacterium]|nr:copper chaperone CopZ [Peptostreptococcaceae bacterium]